MQIYHELNTLLVFPGSSLSLWVFVKCENAVQIVKGTIHILRQHNLGRFMTHPLGQLKISTERQQNWPFSRPNQSFC